MCPFPGTRTIPKDWSAHHAPVAAGAMNGTATVHDPDVVTTGWDPETESPTAAQGAPLYDGPVAVMANQQERATVQAGDTVRTREYLVRFPVACPWLREGLTVTITDGHADPSLTGRVLRVTDAQLGTERFQRDVVCIDSTEEEAAP